MLPLAILAGGYATRLGNLTKDLPKCLIEINGRPFVEWQLDLLIKNGYSDFVFCLSYKSEMVQEYLGDGSSRGVKIQYSLDGGTQLGTGGAIQKALPTLGEAFAVLYGDSYLPINYLAVEKEFLNSVNPALMTVYENKNQFDSSNVEFVQGNLLNYQKFSRDKKMQHIDYGLTYFRSSAFLPCLDRSTFDLSKLCHTLASEGRMGGFEVFERFHEIGSVDGINELSEYLRKESQ
jgi:MurNAc alpha-1-phosphate uridylyltransferase